MIIASKGAAGVTGAGLATLAGGLQSHRPELVDGVGLIVGIDRFMSEARAVTNFAGNAVATVLIGTWVEEIDRDRLDRVLAGKLPFDETHDARRRRGDGAPAAGDRRSALTSVSCLGPRGASPGPVVRHGVRRAAPPGPFVRRNRYYDERPLSAPTSNRRERGPPRNDRKRT